ncbi:hypothetical protein [Arthrobacter sp. JSM 101049]|uniref:hypothetical protein n=1 Tax=Arthrobacter sp. JSM 101049 TaxID=929097 RepID=UPI003566400B
MSADASEITELVHDMGLAPAKLARKIKPIMAKTGLATKRRLQADLRASPHFKPAARSIDYDVKTFGFDGTGIIQVEVGPNAQRDTTAALAGLAYFGGSNGGGGTVADPVVAMRQEEPILLGFLEMATEGLL